jgi:uncharacterized spore protein YtfJ
MKQVLLGLTAMMFLWSGTVFAGAQADGSLNLDASIGKIGDVLAGNMQPATCLGVPVVLGDTTIIPVVSKGFGFGLMGGFNQQEETANHAKDAREVNRDRTGMGCGAGGFVKTIAIISLKKDGTMQIFRMQENFLAQVATHFVPLFHEMVGKWYELRTSHGPRGGPGDPHAPPPPPGR